MPLGLPQKAKRALVSLLLFLARQYGVHIDVTRDSSDKSVETACRKVARRVHPDKGGDLADMQRLQAARDEWQNSRAADEPARKRGREQGPVLPLQSEGVAKSFLIRSSSVLLTYHVGSPVVWREFLEFAESRFTTWGVQRWCASMELCESGRPHIHLMVQFHSATRTRDVNSFCFGDFRPNASATDLCGEKQCKKKLQQSIDRGFFYVFADKLGTVRSADGKMCTEGNYLPCWTTSEQKYQVLGKWPETLWKQRKISDEIYEELLFLTRGGVVSRQRNFQACQARQGKRVSQQAIEDRVKRIRSNPEIYKPFPEIPVVRQWLHLFTKDALRYPILIVLGASRAGKTEYAKSLFQRPLELKIGALEFFPDTMRQFRRGGAGCASAVDGRLCCAVL